MPRPLQRSQHKWATEGRWLGNTHSWQHIYKDERKLSTRETPHPVSPLDEIFKIGARNKHIIISGKNTWDSKAIFVFTGKLYEARVRYIATCTHIIAFFSPGSGVAHVLSGSAKGSPRPLARNGIDAGQRWESRIRMRRQTEIVNDLRWSSSAARVRTWGPAWS